MLVRNVSLHAVDLPSGAVVPPGQRHPHAVDPTDPHVAALLGAEGPLLELPADQEPELEPARALVARVKRTTDPAELDRIEADELELAEASRRTTVLDAVAKQRAAINPEETTS